MTGPVRDRGGVLAGPPEQKVDVPAVVLELAQGRDVRAVWVNELGGVTYRVEAGASAWYVKWAPTGSGVDLSDEAARLDWVRSFSPVPEIIGSGHTDDGSWLATTGLAGESAVSTTWRQEPTIAVTAIGVGLRYLHDHAPPQSCPFSWSAADRVATAEQRAADRLTHPRAWHQCHRHLTLERALQIVKDPPPADRLVVCHGDACAPNTIIDTAGTWSGHVDLGSLGIADRWADLAIATWSTQWNFGPGWEHTLLEAYGSDPDPERTAYYRLLWDLT